MTTPDEQLADDLINAARVLIIEGIRLKAPFGVGHTQPQGHMLIYVRDPELVVLADKLLSDWMLNDQARQQARDG